MSPADRAGLARPHNQAAAAHSGSRPAGQQQQQQQQQEQQRHQHQRYQHHQQHQQHAQAMPSTADSWIEVSSQASSSSPSSAAGDDIVTTGLRVQQNSPHSQRRRRTLASGTPLRLYMADAAVGEAGGGSSQDEYDESGSESDRVLTSSNEGLLRPSSQAHSITHRAPLSATSADTEDDSNLDDEDDEDESATALGVGSNQNCFTPQPNAFSHPPASLREPDSYFSSTATARPQPRSRHQSFSTRTSRNNHSPLSSSHHADHDAALRASLSTLLSCAAAARGLPKQHPAAPRQQSTSNRLEPGSLRMVSGAALRGAAPRQRSPSSSSSSPSSDKKHKRQASSRSSSKERAHLASKKLKAEAGGEAVVSPTLLTWVVSAGVLVLVSALSFGAGYSAGRETGRIEGSLNPTPTVAGDSCGQEALLRGSTSGLRRLRWSEAASAVTAGA